MSKAIEKFNRIYMSVLMNEARFIVVAIILGQFVYDKDPNWNLLGLGLVFTTGYFNKKISKQQGKVLNMVCIIALLAMHCVFGKCYFGLWSE